MKPLELIGLSHSVSPADLVVHTTVNGRQVFGRVADLICEWTEREHGFEIDSVSGLRMLIQAVLEFVVRGAPEGTPLLEFAAPNSLIMLAIRSVWPESIDLDAVEKTFTQHWVNSPQAALLKRVLNPDDRIEVRYQPTTRLVEWRVVRPLTAQSPEELSVSFVVLVDARDQVSGDHAGVIDLGDLPFEEWLEARYHSAGGQNSRSGEVTLEDGETLEEVELARFTIDRQISEEEQKILGTAQEEVVDSDLLVRMGNELARDQGIRAPGMDLIFEELKQQDLLLRRDAWLARTKMDALEGMLNRKERELLRIQKRQKELHSELERLRLAEKSLRESNPFKDKAMQMFDALSKAKKEIQVLEKTVFELRRNEGAAATIPEDVESERALAARSLDEAQKKLDRTQRALEAEKQKSAQFSARALSAERELGKADPIIKDLEMKVETVMKTSNQAKKEVESLKQRLVQADAEKNRIQNELMKAQAQIATLMKRHAS